jgi:amino acid transporter
MVLSTSEHDKKAVSPERNAANCLHRVFTKSDTNMDELPKYDLKSNEPKTTEKQNHELVEGEVLDNADHLQRHLGNRQIQLIAIGGSIGTALFVSINSGLYHGGPGSLFLAYTLYSVMLALVNNCTAEMTTYMPVSGGYIRLAGKWVDEAFGFMAGWNFFFYEALLIPFEITALNLVLSYWRDDIPAGAVIAACIVLYA